MKVQRRQRRFGGVRLVADTSLATKQDEDERGSGVLAGIAAVLSAPVGCNAASKSEAAPTAAKADARVASAAEDGRGPMPGSAGGSAGGNAAPAMEPAAPPPPAATSPAESQSAVEEIEATPTDAPPAANAAPAADTKSGLDQSAEKSAVKDAMPVLRDEDRPAPSQEPPARPATEQIEARRVQAPRSVVARGVTAACSDAAAQDLGQRKLLWERRLAIAPDLSAALAVYESTASVCELPGWKDQRTLLQLVQARANTEQDIALLLAHFADDADARGYLARALLRRLVDPALVAAVGAALFGEVIDWSALDRKIRLQTEPEAQLALLRAALARAPGDPEGERRMMRMLAARGQRDEAIARGRKVREQGWFTPALAQDLGELLVESGKIEEAQRVFSEIVEFDPESFESRRLLGDVFLRHGWYDGAYRQYEDLVASRPDDMTAAIRLARAAAGAGRVDEALRILRKIAAEEGRPGADDPRRFARLHAAAYLAAMLVEQGTPRASIAQELRRLQLFDAPTTWTLLTWHDLDASLVLARTDEVAVDAIAASGTGLFALQTDGGATPLTVRHAGADHARAVSYQRIVVAFDGKDFAVQVEPGAIGPAVPTME
jgi:tetratricopeptide (TPR) repeat protein